MNTITAVGNVWNVRRVAQVANTLLQKRYTEVILRFLNRSLLALLVFKISRLLNSTPYLSRISILFIRFNDKIPSIKRFKFRKKINRIAANRKLKVQQKIINLASFFFRSINISLQLNNHLTDRYVLVIYQE